MRNRAALAATSAALVLAAAAPAATAATTAPAAPFAGHVAGPVTFTVFSANKHWMPVKAATPNSVVFTYTIEHAASDPLSGLRTDVVIKKSDFHGGKVIAPKQAPVCTEADATLAVCEQTLTVDPRTQLKNVDSQSSWDFEGRVRRTAKPSEVFTTPLGGTLYTPRAAYLPVDAGPEPVKKGKVLTVTGAVKRANWETGDYRNYTGNVGWTLWFRKKGSTVQTFVPGTVNDGKGNLTARVVAKDDGYWQWKIQGNATTNRTTSKEDYVDVR
ncbi:hypothetical protein [Streptomyces sp. NPDC089919]|uniref:hypothetical protein n=1 Tax=Streptomyces sp. NPDC089919 TaxID=3155188 RepID=UPI0034454353